MQNYRNLHHPTRGTLGTQIIEGSILGVLKLLGEGNNPNFRCSERHLTKPYIFLAVEMYCSQEGEEKLQIIQALIDHGANLSLIHDNETPLLFANRLWAPVKLLFLLIRNGADPNVSTSTPSGNYPFLASCSHFPVHVLEELVALGADPMVHMRWELDNGQQFEGPMLECFQKGHLEFSYCHAEVLEVLERCAGSGIKG